MKKKRRCVTLVEMMIVMFLIAMIIGVVAYNYRGSLDEGKAFKTQTSIEKIQTILTLSLSDRSVDDVETEWETYLTTSPLVQNPKALMKDGWGEKFEVRKNDAGDGFVVTSKKFEEYKRKNPGTLFGDESQN